MRTFTIALAVTAAVALLSATAAFGGSTFHSGPSFSVNNQGQLVCTGDVSGLGNVSSVTGSCSAANADATYACINNGNKNPAAANKRTVSGAVSGTSQFAVRNGRVKDGTTTVDPPGPGDFSCPGGQTLFLTSVCYTGLAYSIGDASGSSPGPVCNTSPILVRA